MQFEFGDGLAIVFGKARAMHRGTQRQQRLRQFPGRHRLVAQTRLQGRADGLALAASPDLREVTKIQQTMQPNRDIALFERVAE